MSRPSPPVSGGPLLGDEPAPELDEDEPYEPGGVVGRGGMGEVRTAWDRKLQRTVALKTLRGPGSEERFLREARITARLQHPGVVAIYTAGRQPDGTPYYAMRLIEGQSLRDALEARPSDEERLRLVRHVADACRTMAYAHDRGVVHRDLKPANLLVGPFGETQVVDWGLAVQGAELGERVGTPGYQSPEQEAGLPLDGRSDLFALGTVLAELIGPAGPAELAAIARTATATDRSERYADGLAMAADLDAWFEGRRVGAHAYSAAELALRFARAWRAPLVVAALSAAVLAVVAVRAAHRTAAERDRALEAEASALQLGAESTEHLASSLVALARHAEADDLRARAELFAAEALVHRPGDPDALGILAAFGAWPRPERVLDMPLPGCRRVDMSPDGARLACVAADGIQVLDVPSGAVHAAVEGRVGSAAFLDADTLLYTTVPMGLMRWSTGAKPTLLAREVRSERLVVRAGDMGRAAFIGGSEHLLVDREGVRTSGWRCPGVGPTVGAYGPDGTVAVACNDSSVWVGRGSMQRLERTGGSVSALALSDDAERVFVGRLDGSVVVHSAADGSLEHTLSGVGHAVGLLAPHEHLLAIDAPRVVEVWDWARGVRVAKLPGRARAVAWTSSGALRVSTPSRLDEWVLPDELPPVFTGAEGVSGLDVSRAGDRVAIAYGDGVVEVRRARGGAVLLREQVTRDVVKDVAFAPDGERVVAAAASSGGLFMLGLDGARDVWLEGWAHRRVAWLTNGVLALPYTASGHVVSPETGVARAVDLGWFPKDLSADGRGGFAVFDRQGGVFRLRADGSRVEVGADPEAVAVAAWGDRTAVVRRGALVHLEAGGMRALPVEDRGVMDLAWSPDGRLLVRSLVDGSVLVHGAEDGRLLADLRGHDARVAKVVFGASPTDLWTGSWDHTVRRWDLSALDAEPGEVRAHVEGVWGRSAAELLPEGG